MSTVVFMIGQLYGAGDMGSQIVGSRLWLLNGLTPTAEG
jgi:hypothetical protein